MSDEELYCYFQHIPHAVVDIKAIGDHIMVSDVQESVHFVKYKRAENQVIKPKCS